MTRGALVSARMSSSKWGRWSESPENSGGDQFSIFAKASSGEFAMMTRSFL